MVAILLMLGAMVCRISADDDKEKDEDNGEDGMSPLDYFTNPKMAAALDAAQKLKDLIHTSFSSHITKREKTSGFEFLNIWADAQRSRGVPKFALKWIIKRSLKPFATKSNRPAIVDAVEVFEKFLEWGVESETRQFFGIVSKKGDGTTHAIFIYYKLREDGKYNFKKVLFSGKFTLAADLVITRSSRSGFFSSSSRDIINYLPRRGITDADIKSLLNLIVPKIASIFNDFVPADE